MTFNMSITFEAGLKFKFRDPIVGQKLKAVIFMITDTNKTRYGNWTFPSLYMWDDMFYKEPRLLNSEYLIVG